MKRNILCAAVVLLAGSLMAADKDDLNAAIAKLAASDNYSWVSTSTNVPPPGGGGGGGGRRGGGFNMGPTMGKTQKDGLIYSTMTMPGFGGGDPTTMEGYSMGTNKVAVKTEDGWTSLAEATADGGGGGGFNAATFGVRRVQGVRAPADEAKDLASKITNLTMADGAYSGSLPEDAAKAMMTFGGGRGRRGGGGGGGGPEISGAKANVKFWVKDGVLVKFETHLEGTMSFNGNDFPRNTTTTVEIKDIGSTKITIPDEAKKKLS